MQEVDNWGDNTITRLFNTLALYERFLDKDGNSWQKIDKFTAMCEEPQTVHFNEGEIRSFHLNLTVYAPRAKRGQPLEHKHDINDIIRNGEVSVRQFFNDQFRVYISPTAPTDFDAYEMLLELIKSKDVHFANGRCQLDIYSLFHRHCRIMDRRFTLKIVPMHIELHLVYNQISNDMTYNQYIPMSHGAHPRAIPSDHEVYVLSLYAQVLGRWLSDNLDLQFRPNWPVEFKESGHV